MKKTTFTCFLGLLCLFGSKTYSQVASPPATEGPGNVPAPVVVYGEIKVISKIETIEISLWEQPVDIQMDAPNLLFSPILPERGTMKNGAYGKQTFHYHQKIAGPSYLSITANGRTWLDEYLVSPGDSIKLFIDESKATKYFAGPAALKFQIQKDWESIRMQERFNSPVKIFTYDKGELFADPSSETNFIADQDALFGRKVSVELIDPEQMLRDYKTDTGWLDLRSKLNGLLDNYHGDLSQRFLSRLEGEYLAGMIRTRCRTLRNIHTYAIRKRQDQLFPSILQELLKLDMPNMLSLDANSFPEAYTDFLFEKARLYAKLMGCTLPDAITALHKGNERDWAMAKYLYRAYRTGQEHSDRFLEHVSNIGNPALKSQLIAFHKRLASGKPVQHFTMVDSLGNELSIADFKGKVVLLNSWFTGCTASSKFYQNSLEEVSNHFKDHPKVCMISLSADKSKTRWQQGRSSGKYGDPDAVQLNAHFEGLSHPFFRYYHLNAVPSQMLIDQNGNLVTSRGLSGSPEMLISKINELLK